MPNKVLIIEDNIQTQKILNASLTKNGYKVFSSTLGMEGIKVAKVVKPDIILLDLMLVGEFDGIEVLRELKKDVYLNKIPVLVLTNLDNQKEVVKDLGASDYIIKANISLHEIIKKINIFLKK